MCQTKRCVYHDGSEAFECLNARCKYEERRTYQPPLSKEQRYQKKLSARGYYADAQPKRSPRKIDQDKIPGM